MLVLKKEEIFDVRIINEFIIQILMVLVIWDIHVIFSAEVVRNFPHFFFLTFISQIHKLLSVI